jgi:ELWxxDGT repeat protein
VATHDLSLFVGDTLYFSAEGSLTRGIDLSRSFAIDNQAIHLSFDFLRFDTWDGNQFQVFIDGRPVVQQPFYDWQYSAAQSGSSSGVTWSITPTSAADQDLNGNLSNWWDSNDQVFRVTLTIPAERPTIRLGIGSTLDEAIENESYGIRNLEIHLADDPSQLLLSEADNLAERWNGGRSAISTILGNFIGPYGSETNIGRELWRIDNSTGEPVPLDINPGPGGSDPRELFAVGEKLFFTAYMPGVGYELWTLDPADNYPYLVADINPGEASSRGDRSYSWWHGWNWRPYGDNSVEAAAGRIYFSALGPEGLELYVVAPSTAGAQLIDLNAGTGGSEPQLLKVVGDRLFFKAFDGSKWALYGTNVESGLPYELTIPGLTNAESVQNLITVGERLYLVSDAYSDDGTVYGALYSIDTRTDEASRTEDISQVTRLTVVSGRLFFRAYSSITGRYDEWFVLKPEDPSQAANLIDFQSGWWGSSIESLDSSSDAIYSVAYGRPLEDLSRSFDLADEAVSISFEFLRLDTWDGEHLRLYLDGQEVFSEPFVYYYDFSDQSRTGEAAGYSWSITPISGIDHFTGNENYLDQLFQITVTIPAGRRSIRLSLGSTLDEDPNNEGYGIRNLEIRSAVDPSQLLLADQGHDPSLWSGGRSASSATLGAFLGVFGGTKEWNLWRLDPHELTRTMRPLLPAAAPNKQSVSNLFSVGNTLYFSYDDGVTGHELWQSDGTAEGTRLAADVNGRSLPAHPRDLTDVNGRLFFTADDGVNGRGLYTLDTATGLVQRLAVPGLTAGKDAYIDSLMAAEEKLFFRSYNSNDAGIYQPLYNLDPTSLAISQVADVSHVNSLQYLQGQLFFSAYSSTHQEGYELFRIADGSLEPELIDVNPGSGSSDVQDLVQAGGVVFFTAVRDGLGRELFRLDESRNAVPARDIRPGNRGSDPHLLFVVDNTLYFVADDGFHGRELWQSNGTEAGTRLARDINTLTLDASPEGLVDVNGILYFKATDGRLGRGLYRIDPASGRPQRLVIPGLTGGNEATVDGLINASGRLYFRSHSSSDEGTYQPLFTLDPATGSISQVAGVSHVNGLKHLNGQLFFTAYSETSQEGYELFRIAVGSVQPQLIDINPGTGSSHPDHLTLHDGTIYLAARRDDIGRELFRLGPDFVPLALAT